MTQPEFTINDPSAYAREVLARSQAALSEAVRAVSPQAPDADPLSVFPAPAELRADSIPLSLTTEQETELRAAAAKLGFERPTNLTLSEQGIRGAHVVLEGGQPHKIWAELTTVITDGAALPSSIIFAASPHRDITNPAEMASATRLLGYAPSSEHEVAIALANKLLGDAAAEATALPVGYDIDNNNQLLEQATGQFMHLGNFGSIPVIVMAIDREDYTNPETGKPAYRKQPGTADVLKIVSAASDALGGERVLPVAMVTSATYQPSRTVAVAQAALESGRQMGLATYGTELLVSITGKEAEPKRIDQLPGELHKMAVDVMALDTMLNSAN